MPISASPSVSIEELCYDKKTFSLDSGQLHVWSIDFDTNKNLVEICNNAITEAEQQRAMFFKFEKVQDNYVISQGMLRLLLSQYLDSSPKEIRIARHKFGKPYPQDYPNLRFNISNSGRRAVYAFSLDEEVGIDLEKLRELPDLDELIQKNFTTNEQAYINSIPEKRSYRFFKFWTIKEAYLKAVGEGMRLPPDNLEFKVENETYKLESIRGVFEEQADWIFSDFSEEPYIGTLAYKNKLANISLRSLV